MIGLKLIPETRAVRRRLGRVARQNPKWVSQELNRQLRASKGGTGKGRTLPVVGMARRIRDASGIKPLKRIARRIRFPRSAFATPRKLIAGGLTLFESMPMRYFTQGLPSGVKEIDQSVDPSGRQLVGGAFVTQLTAGKKKFNAKMRRAMPKWRREPKNPKTGHLPINFASYADVTPLAYRARFSVLRDLAKLWPSQMARRWRKEFKRIFRA